MSPIHHIGSTMLDNEMDLFVKLNCISHENCSVLTGNEKYLLSNVPKATTCPLKT